MEQITPLRVLIQKTLEEKENSQPQKLRAGDQCPNCKTERLDYDGLLNLSCPDCGPAAVGCFT